MKVSQFVKQYRKDRRLSQKALATKLQVHAQYVSNVERFPDRYQLAFIERLMPILTVRERYALKKAAIEDLSQRLRAKIKVRG